MKGSAKSKSRWKSRGDFDHETTRADSWLEVAHLDPKKQKTKSILAEKFEIKTHLPVDATTTMDRTKSKTVL